MNGATFDDYNNEKEENFKTILDYTRLHDWNMCGPGRFDLVDNTIVSNGGMGLLWYTEKQFRDFILKVHWKTCAKGDNSGVFVRFADPDDDPGIAVNTGLRSRSTMRNHRTETPRIEQEPYTISRHLQPMHQMNLENGIFLKFMLSAITILSF